MYSLLLAIKYYNILYFEIYCAYGYITVYIIINLLKPIIAIVEFCCNW